MLLVVGMPLLLLELALGQKLRVGAARAWYKVSFIHLLNMGALGGLSYHLEMKLIISLSPCPGSPSPWWDRVRLHGGGRLGGLLLQRHHRLVHLLPLVLHECEWGAILKHLNKSASAQRVA